MATACVKFLLDPPQRLQLPLKVRSTGHEHAWGCKRVVLL